MQSTTLFELAKKHAATDYADPESVARSNRVADEIHKRIQTLAPTELSAHLDSGPLQSWVAYFVLEHRGQYPGLLSKALAIVRLIAAGSDLAATAARLKLEEYDARA